MSIIVNGEFHLDETWVVMGTVRDYQSEVIDLSNATIRLRIAHSNGQLMLDLSTPGDGEVVSADEGTYEFVIDSTQQGSFTPGNYKYEVKAVLANGWSSVQNTGTIAVRPSLFSSNT